LKSVNKCPFTIRYSFVAYDKDAEQDATDEWLPKQNK
jgi:hypothetical protein